MTNAVALNSAQTVPVPVARRRPLGRRIFRIIERGLAITGLLLIVYHLAFSVEIMTSNSMTPTLQGNGGARSDWILSERVTHWFRSPRRWELLSFTTREGVRVMKRVIALPGENVTLDKQGTFSINGEAVERPASIQQIEYFPWGTLSTGNPVPTEKGYFVLGDYSKDSDDSRWNRPVQPDAVNGRPWLIIWPLSRIGFVNP
jgi:signal peptidase I